MRHKRDEVHIKTLMVLENHQILDIVGLILLQNE